MTRLLIVEDERDLADMLVRLFADEGYDAEAAYDGQQGLHLLLTRAYHAIVLDRGLPAIDGLDLLTRIRRRGVQVPVLVLTARGTVADRVEGLDAGAEDYLVKPFDVEELLARIRALVRRTIDDAEVLPLGARRLDLGSRIVIGNGQAVRLSPRECDLLRLLATRPTRVFTRADLRDLVFDEADSDAVVDTYVHYLRRKLGRGTIRTVRGVGYQMGAV